MLDERIQRAKRAELEEAATDSERGWLVLGRKGLCDASRLVARIRLRASLGFPRHGCVKDDEGCGCLDEALDAALESGASVGRDEILKAAEAAHAERVARRPAPLPPLPEPAAVVAEEANSAVLAASDEDVATPASEPPLRREPEPEKFRVVRRTRKWFDPPSGVLDRKF
jgi:hypothetical protein